MKTNVVDQVESPPDRNLSLPARQTVDASVIIIGYNHRHCLARLLDSIQAANPGPREVILVDNASQDDTISFVQANYAAVRVLALEENAGFAAANNLGARLAHGEYLVFLNPDTWITPGSLEALIEPLEHLPGIGLSTAKVLLADGTDRLNAFGNDLHLSGITLCRKANVASSSIQESQPVSAVSGAACAMRRNLFFHLGGFDPAYFLYMEDTDLSLRARLAGYACVAVPGALIFHDYRLRFGSHKVFYQERNRYRLLAKHYRVGTCLVLLPACLLAEAITWGFTLLRAPDQWRGKLRAYSSFVKSWRELRQARRATQMLRRVRDRDLLLAGTWRLDFAQTGPGPAARLAGLVFNPLFGLSHLLVKCLVWW